MTGLSSKADSWQCEQFPQGRRMNILFHQFILWGREETGRINFIMIHTCEQNLIQDNEQHMNIIILLGQYVYTLQH